jgi:hypothetical protein
LEIELDLVASCCLIMGVSSLRLEPRFGGVFSCLPGR